LFNKLGTAPGMWFEKDKKHFISMPGVPFEMKYLMNTHVLPELQSRFSEIVIVHKTILTQGVPESILADIIATWELELPDTIKLAYLPSEGRVRLRLSTRGKDKEVLNSIIDEQIEKLKLIIPKLIFGEENDTLAQRIGQELLRVNASVGSAESCTGGYVAHLITQVSGASAYFKGSVLAYNATVKQTVLGVRAKTIADFGVVSKQVAEEMALGVQQLMKVDYAIATTGIAGPLGGTIDNPVGTIWTSVATPNGVQSVKYQLGTERVRNIKRSSTAVLLDLLHILERVDKKGE